MNPSERPVALIGPATVVLVALGLYVVSFLVPAIDDGNQQINFRITERLVPGWVVFLKVPMYLVYSLPYWPAWLANPCLWIGVLLLMTKRWVAARRWAVAAAVLASTSLLALVTTAHWLTPHVGFFLWLAGVILFAVGVRWNELRRLDSQNLAWRVQHRRRRLTRLQSDEPEPPHDQN